MPSSPIQILLVEDEPADALFIQEALIQDASTVFQITVAQRLSEAFSRIIERHFQVVLLDLGLPDCQGLETFERVRRIAPGAAIVVLSGRIDEKQAIIAVQAGAQDYLLKGDVNWAVLSRSIRYAIERQDARLALQASENRFRAMIENSRDAIVLMTANGVITYASPALKRLLDYSPDELIGRNAFEFAHPDGMGAVTEMFNQVLHHAGTPFNSYFRARHKDGRWRLMEATTTNLLDLPEVGAIILNFRDATEQRQAEEQIRFQASLLQNVSDAIIATDRQFHITSWNHGAVNLYGYTEAEVIGRSVTDILQSRFHDEKLEDVLAQFQEKGSWKGVSFQTTKDSRQIAVLSSVSMIRDASGAPTGVVAVNREIPMPADLSQLTPAEALIPVIGDDF